MANNSGPDHRLWVVVSDGVPRSGKGTINGGLCEGFAGAESEETGADYRAVTFGMIQDGKLDPEMNKEDIGLVVASLGQEAIASYATGKLEIIEEHGKDVLYGPEVGSIVQFVSPFDSVRDAVKLGFTRRVQKRVSDPDVQLLFVDGRNLAPIVEKVPGANILLRLFVDCQPIVAALREAARLRIPVVLDENNDWFQTTLEAIKKRQREDEARRTDRVVKDERAIDYWYNNRVMDETVSRLSKIHDMTFAQAALMVVSGSEDFRRDGRYGAGAKAFAEGRQVYFDTSEIQKEPMVDFARRLVDEALEQHAGLYVPSSGGLIEA